MTSGDTTGRLAGEVAIVAPGKGPAGPSISVDGGYTAA